MREDIRRMVLDNDLCVLATAAGDRPHCSLMAYATDAGGRLLLATRRDSRKFRNIEANPQVSLLIDTRTTAPDQARTLALTVTAHCYAVQDGPDREAARSLLAARHPHLAGLLSMPDLEILRIHPREFLLLEGPEKAVFESAGEQGQNMQ